MTRIPVSWIVLIAVLAVFGFFTYQILQASGVGTKQEGHTPPFAPDAAAERVANALPEKRVQFYGTENGDDSEQVAAPVAQKQPPVPKEMPHVPGQTEEDLRAVEPLQQTPPAVQYDAPEANDTMHQNVFMSAGFGSNLRHPEQMIEMHPRQGMGQAVAAGLAAERSSPGGNRASGYSPEMIQNAGEFMQGVSAFDGSDVGTGFSAL